MWLWFMLASAAANGISWTLITPLARSHQTFSPLHYTIYFGPDLSLNARQLFLLPAVGAFIVVVNLIASSWNDDQLWRRTWGILTLTMIIILTAVTAALVYVSRTTP